MQENQPNEPRDLRLEMEPTGASAKFVVDKMNSTRRELLEQQAAAYAERSDLDPRLVDLVEYHRPDGSIGFRVLHRCNAPDMQGAAMNGNRRPVLRVPIWNGNWKDNSWGFSHPDFASGRLVGDALRRMLDSAVAQGAERLVVSHPGGWLNEEEFKEGWMAGASSQFWPHDDEWRTRFADAFVQWRNENPEVEVFAYLGSKVFLPLAQSMMTGSLFPISAIHGASEAPSMYTDLMPINPTVLQYFLQAYQPWLEMGFDGLWLDASSEMPEFVSAMRDLFTYRLGRPVPVIGEGLPREEEMDYPMRRHVGINSWSGRLRHLRNRLGDNPVARMSADPQYCLLVGDDMGITLRNGLSHEEIGTIRETVTMLTRNGWVPVAYSPAIWEVMRDAYYDALQDLTTDLDT